MTNESKYITIMPKTNDAQNFPTIEFEKFCD